LAFLACTVGLSTIRVTSTALAGDPADQLHRIESFALGGIGIAGTMSEGEQALRALLHDPNATAQLQELLTNATPAGQLYALLGLRTRDRAAYDHALKDFKAPNVEVQTIGGCIIWRAPFKQLLDRIKAGEYDHSLSRPFGN
jgi:hypothetical protein